MKPKKKDISPQSGTPGSKDIDYSKDPFFIKKHEEAQKHIDKYGIPKEFLERKK